ncbi:hypothetical protein HN592_04070 [Candidatus Woesearchaeota archaeon]|jgi:phosphate uptake regulator|nr:hypothetical protein [Candidatus Woesearchaeota archaeon]MBT4368388.1 hypothetical protein [Candidatus Woesearchaeota archaeon]MBT4712877.1 hypothetical protein [Candidatus Woesearchaeota archaeon]MBT6639789.1 hypothetical protein [Candidatus Woesearchaeota archaeon]MBT7133961.1 hypothetical protein [Candidatus Woesearchaeota archaeon]
MDRKLIKQGGGGFTIYLPKKWVDEKGLTGGDKVNLSEANTALIVNSSKPVRKEKVVEITKENKKDIKTILTHLYRNGFDIIHIKETTKTIQKEIKQITEDLLLGFEITETTEGSCTLENLSEPSETKYSVLLRRVFLIIRETEKLVIADFQKNSFKHEADIAELRKQQDKFVLFCKRLLVKEKYLKNSFLEWELLKFLMHIEHAYYYLYQFAMEGFSGDKTIITFIKNLQSYFGLFYDAHFKNDKDAIYQIDDLKTKYQLGSVMKYFSQTKDPLILSQIRELFRLVQIGASSVLSKLYGEEEV